MNPFLKRRRNSRGLAGVASGRLKFIGNECYLVKLLVSQIFLFEISKISSAFAKRFEVLFQVHFVSVPVQFSHLFQRYGSLGFVFIVEGLHQKVAREA